MTTIELIICAALVITSGYLSASEVALFSLSRFQIRFLRERFSAIHRYIKKLLDDPGGLLLTILVINELVNISLSTIVAGVVVREWGESGPWVVQLIPSAVREQMPIWMVQSLAGLLITAPIVLLLCEITPKVIGTRANQIVAALSARPLTLLYASMKPVRATLKFLLATWSRLLGKNPLQFDTGEEKPLLKEDEFLVMVEEGLREGAINESEMGLIRAVFTLDDTEVREIYTPMAQVSSVSESLTVTDAMRLRAIREYSRIPVTRGKDRSQVSGILYTKDLLAARISKSVQDQTILGVMRRPFTVAPQMKLNTLFRLLKKNQVHLAVVENDNNQALGIVTMADILEELFEDVLANRSEVEGDPLK